MSGLIIIPSKRSYTVKIFEHTLNIFAASVILFFFFPWFTIGNTVSFSGATLPQGAKNLHIMTSGLHTPFPSLILLTYVVYLVPITAFIIIVTDSIVKEREKSRNINKLLACIPLAACIVSLLYFFITGGAGAMNSMSPGAYLTCAAALFLIPAAFGVIRTGSDR